MVGRIGSGGGLAREAILAALRSQADKAEQVRQKAAEISARIDGSPAGHSSSTGFSDKLHEGIRSVDAAVKNADQLPEKLLSGEIGDFHEVAVQIKEAELSFRFSMEIRNKLIDAYREVMRMNV